MQKTILKHYNIVYNLEIFNTLFSHVNLLRYQARNRVSVVHRLWGLQVCVGAGMGLDLAVDGGRTRTSRGDK